MACESCNTCQGCNRCQGCNTCEGCNGCQGCNKCQGCDKCQKCDKCQSDQKNYPCMTEQSYATTKTLNLASLCGDTFGFSPCPQTNSTLMGPKAGQFNKATWDSICEWISQRSTFGEKHKGGSTFASSSAGNVSPFKASEFQRVSNELGAGVSVSAGELIRGSYFQSLESAAASYEIDPLTCDNCNTQCDTTCDACVKCDNCEVKCNTGDSSCYNGCSDSDCYDSEDSESCEDTKA